MSLASSGRRPAPRCSRSWPRAARAPPPTQRSTPRPGRARGPAPPVSSGACPGDHADAPARGHRARPATKAPASSANPIPQGNGGDQDPDNNGGPSDGDGNI